MDFFAISSLRFFHRNHAETATTNIAPVIQPEATEWVNLITAAG